MAVQVIYSDISPDAANASSFSASDMESFSTLDLNNGGPEPYAITLETNRWILDGSGEIFGGSAVYWSDTLSDSDGDYAVSPVITVDFSQYVTSDGITLFFDETAEEFAYQVSLTWLQDGTTLASETYTVDSAIFFCEQAVTNYNQLLISIDSSGLPDRRARLDKIMFGKVFTFSGANIRSASVVNECNLISAELPASALNAVMDIPAELTFQAKQSFEISANGYMLGTYYLTDSARQSSTIYKISAQDAIGVLNEQYFDGGAYLSGISAESLVQTIIGDAFEIVFDGVTDTTLYGLLMPMSKRDALQQVLFAWGVACRTDGGSVIRIFEPPTVPVEIGRDRTYLGVSVDQLAAVTKVNVTAHTFAVDADGSWEVGGVKYSDTETVYTASLNVLGKENIIESSGCTLISTHNGQAAAQRILDYYARPTTHKSKIIWQGEHLGDCVNQPTPWETTQDGNIESISITISGIIAASVESLEVS